MPTRLKIRPLRREEITRGRTHKAVLDARSLLTKTAASTAELQAQARRLGTDALRALEEIVKSPVASEVARISAAQTILDRGHGKPTQMNVTATVNTDGKPTEITDKELSRRIEDTLRAAEALTRTTGIRKRKREKIQSETGPVDLRKLH